MESDYLAGSLNLLELGQPIDLTLQLELEKAPVMGLPRLVLNLALELRYLAQTHYRLLLNFGQKVLLDLAEFQPVELVDLTLQLELEKTPVMGLPELGSTPALELGRLVPNLALEDL